MRERLDFEPGKRTIELFDHEPILLHGVLWEWWSEVCYLICEIESGYIPKPERLFHKSIRHVVLYCDSEGRVNPEPLQRICDQISARWMKTLCVCGGKGITYCDRCATRLERDANWASIDEMKDTFAQAMAVKDRLLGLAKLKAELRSPHLGIELGDRVASRQWEGKQYGPVDFGKKERPWQLFGLLVNAGDDGMHRKDLEGAIGSNLDNHKATLLAILRDLKLHIEVGRWKLKHLG